ncbi:glycoside hydrolase family 2 TIM barrel-domain containing protein [Microlunatus endophyticus]|nr:glycoside hydrolase family 2 TIM barrel-domain containing protein [Microlunatus endophyticus]
MATERLLWTPERPTLIDADIEVTHGTDSDRVSSYLGLRSIEVRDGQLMLNGRPYFLRMVLEQGYWPQSQLAAPDPAALRTEVELIKELGFNAARIHQKVEDPRFLYWCDRLGLAVWGEMANAFAYSARSCELLLHEWPAVLRRDRSHPSILGWVPINESWGVTEISEHPAQQDFATAMYYLTKAIDPTRPAMSNEGWEHTESDIWGIHDYTPSGDGIRARYSDQALPRTLTDRGPGRRRILVGDRENRGQAVMITEFGGLSYAPEVGQHWFGYSTVTSEAEYLDRFEDLVTAITEQPALMGFCYTQLTDTLQENNGLLHADRTPKLPVERIRAVVTTPAKAIPAEEVDSYRRAAQERRLHGPAGA